MGTEGFRKEQRGVAFGAAGALVVSVLSVWGWLTLGPAAPEPLAERLAGALRWQLLPALTLAVGVGRVANGRFSSPGDIAGAGFGEPSERIAQARAVLQNTTEQVLLALIVHLALAASAPIGARLVPVLAMLFLAGRVLFAAGYGRGAAGRAFGFGLTFYPSVGGLVFALALQFR